MVCIYLFIFYLAKKSSFGESSIFEDLPPNLLHRLVLSIYSTEVDAKTYIDKNKNPFPKKDKTTIDEQKKTAYEHLKFLSGHNLKNQKIMTDEEFKRLINYTNHLIEKNKLPDNLKMLSQININAEYIRYTYYNIHKLLYGTRKINTTWIDFLKGVFSQFKNTEWKTIKTKFSKIPDMYIADLKQLKK